MLLDYNRVQQNQYEKNLIDACLFLLENENVSSHIQLRSLLIGMGFDNINIVKLSNLLSNIGIAKCKNAAGDKFYKKIFDDSVFSFNYLLIDYIKDISHNDHCIIVKTKDGFSKSIEQLINFNCKDFILSCIAGFNSIMVMPAKHLTALQCEQELIEFINKYKNA
ncbi:arginine repressor [Shewanella sp. NFH-SH190041]|uniref:hypothetical protein n=1 Tax=Shewanella sp. NFH-SH190041 TaxID=2950245 RepID=UPI0021C3C29E|nr:hypothetical protein [Shewanella sp. NFH-SH190041]BDM66018.1 arginine repressor [Shewanella sp. NFH-SH190041]